MTTKIYDFGEFARHGGALDMARRTFPRATEPWIDLSTGINPVPYPVAGVPPKAWTRLPEETALATLERAAAERYRVPLGLETVAAPGTQAIIQQLPALCHGDDVRILGRSYGEYERVYRDRDIRVRRVPTLAALAGADVAVVVNPNNPDGLLVAASDLLGLASRVGTLLVDEAFVDALPPDASIVRHLPTSRIIVLRSFGKIYGLAGLRLGFAVAPLDRAAALRRALGPWPVSGPAITIGTAALGDKDWLDKSRARLVYEAGRLQFLLGHAGATVIGGTPLFTLAAHPAAPALFAALAGRGILIRPFSGEPTWLRFGHPGSEAQWARLEAALRAF